MSSEIAVGMNIADCWFNEIKKNNFQVCGEALIGSLAREGFISRLTELFEEETEEWNRQYQAGLGESKSPGRSLLNKLDLKLDNSIEESANEILNRALSARSFSGPKQLNIHLTEGSQLQISQLASDNLSVPCGKYIVWTRGVDRTTLVPTDKVLKDSEVFEDNDNGYDLFTTDLLKNWNYIEKVLAESEDDDDDDIPSAIDMSTVDRTPIVRSMEQQGHTVTSLAKAVGVEPPAISRILRIPKRTKGDPGGRNPSIGLAARIANELRVNPEALFPDIFGTMRRDLKPRKPPANTGSGTKQSAKGSTKKGKSSFKK